MPHLVLEYSAELNGSHDLRELAGELFRKATGHPVFATNPKAVKVRTIACENVRSGVKPETFAHLTVRLLSGRTTEAKRELAQDFLGVLNDHLAGVGCLTVETIDMDTGTYAKRVLQD